MSERCEAGDLSPTTLKELRRFARADFAFWNDRSIQEIDAFSVDGYARWLRGDRELAPKSVRNALGQLRAFCTWLRRLERIERIPEFPRVRVPEHAPTIISPRTQEMVLGAISWDERGAFLACCLGVRPGEARALDFKHVQERDSVPGLLIAAAVKGSNAQSPIRGTKTGDASWIPISKELADWIEWRREQRTGAYASRALFVNPGAYLGPQPGRPLERERSAPRLACSGGEGRRRGGPLRGLQALERKRLVLRRRPAPRGPAHAAPHRHPLHQPLRQALPAGPDRGVRAPHPEEAVAHP
jgi:integrase